VLLEFLRILRFHVDRGVRTVRSMRLRFSGKRSAPRRSICGRPTRSSGCIRLLADYCDHPLVLITETNVPNAENLSYFGNRNEAHVVYNFSLPPLLLHALLQWHVRHLNAWQMSMPPAQLGCTYFNFHRFP
jgi:sucrose phosphorylase